MRARLVALLVSMQSTSDAHMQSMLPRFSANTCALCLHSMRARAYEHTRGSVRACSNDEVERSQRRRDNDARRSELEAPTSDLVDDESMATLRDYIDVIEEKETKMAEIKDMLRGMQAGVGIRFLGNDDEILSTAWVFVGLNILIAIYAINGLLVEPVVRTLGMPL